jgi:hypothetical protein
VSVAFLFTSLGCASDGWVPMYLHAVSSWSVTFLDRLDRGSAQELVGQPSKVQQVVLGPLMAQAVPYHELRLPYGDHVIGRQVGARKGWLSVAIVIVLLGWTSPGEAQQGLRSRPMQISLIARVSARAAIESIAPAVEAGRIGPMKQASVSLRLSANSGCRLVVLRTPTSGNSRIWVKNAAGHFEELEPGTAVTVARDRVFAGESEREVRYLFEENGAEIVDASNLPVRYEIRMDPAS